MNPSALESKIPRLAEAGKQHHQYTYINMVAGVKLCSAAPGGEPGAPCECGADVHNAAVKQAAAEALAELEKLTRKLDECVWPEEHEEELIWWLPKGIDAAGAAWLTPRMLREAKRMETP